MKNIRLLLSAGLVSMFAGCTSTQMVLAPVGPNPAASATQAADGRLQVFSRLIGRSEGNNPAWYQHSGYFVYDADGKRIRYVDNTIGRYEEATRPVRLAPGKYFVKAHANDYFWVYLPVVIERGQTTRIHLDDQWHVPANVPKTAIVSLPNGNPVGWRAEAIRATVPENQSPEVKAGKNAI